MLDPTVYLSSFGWKGKGNGLQQGSAARPLAIRQKRTLAGLGKDRDEAFPFWDDIFAATANSIRIKISGDGVEKEIDPTPQPAFLKTTTGILSNRRPVVGTPANSGTATPIDSSNELNTTIPRTNSLAIAKRENSRKQLYAAFFRGPILGPDTKPTGFEAPLLNEPQSIDLAPEADERELERQTKSGNKGKRKRKHDTGDFGLDESKKRKKQRKQLGGDVIPKEEMEEVEDAQNNETAEKSCSRKGQSDDERKREKANRRAAKADRKRIKEERRRAKLERRTKGLH